MQRNLFNKIAIISTTLFNFINFEWSNNGLVHNSSPYHTITSLLPQICLNWIKSILWPIYQVHQTMKIFLDKPIFIYFLFQFWSFEVFAFIRGGFLGDFFFFFFTNPNSKIILHLWPFLSPLILAFSKIWVLVKSGCFSITCFNLHSFGGSKFLKPFLPVLNLLFSTAFVVQWSLLSSFNISKVDFLSVNNFDFFFQQLLGPFLYPYFNIYIVDKKIFFFLDFRVLKLILV